MTRAQSIVIDEARWERIVELTGEAASECLQCGDCTVLCRWGLFDAGGPDMLALLRNAQLGGDGNPALEAALWRCATCGSCEPPCQRGVQTSDIVVGLRSLAYEEGRAPHRIEVVLDNLRRTGDPEAAASATPASWATELDTAAADSASCLVYFGSATCNDPRMQRIARAFASVLHAAEVEFRAFNDEPDSGSVVRLLGAQQYLEGLIDANLREFADLGVREIVATSPYDYDLFRRIYPAYGDGFRVFHATEYLDQLLRYESLSFGLELDEPRWAVYHDPCYLGRQHSVFNAPRRVLNAMPGLELLEFSEAREEAACCGGGGARLWLEPDAGDGFADQRVLEAKEQGADLIVTPCPYCIRMFEASIAKLSIDGLDVRDVVELAAAWWPYAPAGDEDSTFNTYNIG